MKFSLASAFEAATNDRLASWVGDFLASRGSDNEVLAAALAQNRHWWLGPLRLPVTDLVRIAGPEDDVPVPIEPDEWEDDVEEMEESLEEGWEPPPLLVEHRAGTLILQDGTHRCEALARSGEREAWCLVMFAEESERDGFRRSHPVARSARAPAADA